MRDLFSIFRHEENKMHLNNLLGKFAKKSNKLQLTDLNGNIMDHIEFGVTVVSGPFRLVTKDQISRVIGIVTESMTNSFNEKGERVFKFQGNGWKPEGKVGDILLEDVENTDDRWACGADLFGGTGWNGEGDISSITYAKPGKPCIALELPEGMKVISREGERVVPADCLLAMTKADKGDFYIWTPDVVKKHVRDYGA